MTKTDIESACTIHADPEDLARRLFSFDNPLSIAAGLVRAKALVRNDPGLRYANLVHIEKYGRGIAVAASESSDWVASSGEAAGIERQVYVHSRIGNVSLAKSEFRS